MIPTQFGFPINCKTQRIHDELHSGKVALRLIAILVAVTLYIIATYRTIPEITEIFRTDAEQRAIYPDKPDPKSVHQYWRGIDIVVRGLGAQEHRQIRDWINHRFPYGKGNYKTCKYHDAGTGYHLHLQVKAL